MPRRVVATTFVTLDGFMDEPGHWSFPFWSQEASDFKAKELEDSEALLLGRVTYEGFAAAWPAMRDQAGPFGVRMNDMPKYVASRTLKTATWNATILQGEVADAVRALKQEDGGDLLLSGSCQLIDHLTQHDLVDEYRLMVHPILLGDGTKRLFGSVPRRRLELVDTLRFPTGVMVNTYRPAAAEQEAAQSGE